MEVDTGAAVSIVSVSTYNRLWSGQSLPLQATATSLRTYTGEKIDVRGSAAVCVEYLDQKEQLELLVVAGTGPSLLGRDWLLKLRLNWSSINKLQGEPTSEVQVILDRHTEVFKDELGRPCLRRFRWTPRLSRGFASQDQSHTPYETR